MTTPAERVAENIRKEVVREEELVATDPSCLGCRGGSMTHTCGDSVNHPPHYNKHPSGVECIQVVEQFNFNRGNAIKYVWRADHRRGLEDLKKARWYLDRESARLEALEADKAEAVPDDGEPGESRTRRVVLRGTEIDAVIIEGGGEEAGG
jgi:hypothetical protein